MIPIFLRSFTQYKKSWASPVHNIPRRYRHLVVGKTMNCGTEHDVHHVCVKFEQPRCNARRSSIWLWKMHLIWQQSDEARRELAKAKVLSWMQAIFLRYYTKPCLASELTRPPNGKARKMKVGVREEELFSHLWQSCISAQKLPTLRKGWEWQHDKAFYKANAFACALLVLVGL